jgi:hypothetical protein
MRISSFEKNPAVSGNPASASDPIVKVQNVQGMKRRSPPIAEMLFECTAWMSEPAPRNSSALKKPWVKRWKIDAV